MCQGLHETCKVGCPTIQTSESVAVANRYAWEAVHADLDSCTGWVAAPRIQDAFFGQTRKYERGKIRHRNPYWICVPALLCIAGVKAMLIRGTTVP